MRLLVDNPCEWITLIRKSYKGDVMNSNISLLAFFFGLFMLGYTAERAEYMFMTLFAISAISNLVVFIEQISKEKA